MIDPTRWILVEAWMSLGLRVEWAPGWDMDQIDRGAWQQPAQPMYPRYLYHGDRVWYVERTRDARGVPELAMDDMRHELAHYLVASPEERRQTNFNLRGDAQADDIAELRCRGAEEVISAMIRATSRIASLALGAGDGRTR